MVGAAVEQRVQELEQRLDETEGRVRQLETWLIAAMGAAQGMNLIDDRDG